MAKPKRLEIIKSEPLHLPDAIATTPMTLLQMAVSSNVEIEKLERLMAMQEKWQAQKAKEAFLDALSNFQADCPEIKRLSKANYPSKSGGNVSYKFATLGAIEAQIKKPMKGHGLSKRWETKFEVGKVIVTCLVTHKAGHTEKSSVEGPLDDSGNKNAIHSIGSSISYFKRYSLLDALGISTADEDNDAKGVGKNDGVDLPTINEEGFKAAMKSVISGELTVAHIKEKRSLTPDQLKSLETAEKAITQKP